MLASTLPKVPPHTRQTLAQIDLHLHTSHTSLLNLGQLDHYAGPIPE